MAEKFKLSDLAILAFAKVGVTVAVAKGINDPDFTRDDFEFHLRAEREIDRRINIHKAHEQKKRDEENNRN